MDARKSLILEISYLEKRASEMILWRGTQNILPSKIDHAFLCRSCRWGAGTYMSPDMKVAKSYAFRDLKMGEFGVLTQYSLSGLKTLFLKEKVDFNNVHPTEDFITFLPPGKKKLKLKESKINVNQVTHFAEKAGYTALDIEQEYENITVILKGHSPKPISYTIAIPPTSVNEDFEYREIPASQVKDADKLIKASMKSPKPKG